MWRKRDEEWEERQRYLLQSVIDTPRLSTIPETDQVNLDYSESREPSPLPDLIIEKEKIRHDEPEEFYQALEVKMKKLYKKLFLRTDDNSIAETSGSLEQSQRDRDSSQLNLYVENLTEDSDMSETCLLNEASKNMVHDNFTESEKYFESVETERSPSLAHEIIVTQAIIHREVANDDFEDLHNNETTNERVSRSRSTESITFEPTHKKIDYSSKYKNTQQRHKDPERLVVRQAKADKIIKTDEIEVMRHAGSKSKSLGSIAEETTQSKETESLTFLGALEVKAISLTPNTSPETPVVHSDSSQKNILNKACNLNKSDKSATKRPSSCSNVYEGTQNKKKRPNTASVSVQTDPIKTNLNWEELRGNFFVGTPLIYKLCICRSHVCN